MFGDYALLSMRRFFLLWCIHMLLFVTAIFFIGTGYALMILALMPVLLVLPFFSDKLGFIVYGRERYMANIQSILRVRESIQARIVFLFIFSIWFTLALWVILNTNVKLIDVF